MKAFRSVRTKLLAVVLLTTLCALFVAGGSILIYDINVYRNSRINDMATLMELIAFSSTPALQFTDVSVAQENLGLLQIRPSVRAAALYDARGNLFASYTRGGAAQALPELPENEGVTLEGDRMELYQRIIANGEILGTAYMRADYLLSDRILGFVGILCLVALMALAVAILLSVWLQSIFTRPILSIAGIARRVVAHKDYSRRAEKLTEDEVGTLVDAFNDMLREIENRTRDLENTNEELNEEVAQRKRAREEVMRLNRELEEKVQELREADRNKDEFLATLAHELRNPLAPIRSGLSVLRQADERQREELYPVLERQTRQLVHLVNDLMDVSRISRGKVRLQKQMVSLDTVLQGAVEATRDLIDQKEHSFRMDLPREKLLLYVDPVRMTQVFQNLLSNAAHYTNAGGAIVLQARRHDESLEVRVRDNGIGLSEEMLERIFEPFIQSEDPLSRERGGLGIGLTLARALLEMHGASIHAVSEGQGKGTEFIVALALAAREPPPEAEPLDRDRDTGAEHRRRILVVDDNEDVANTLAMALGMDGHKVQVAFSGRDALVLGQDFRPHIVLMDLGMPEMNGLEAAREVRKSDWGRNVTLVAVTGWGQERHREETRQGGFDLHLVKPVTAEDLEGLLAGQT